MFSYLCTDVYVKEADAGVRWDDAEIGIDWPVSDPSLSAKDAKAPFLDEVPVDRLPVYRP
ncbi:dTDP-4-dehydrorhamnose 3,5-epimerase [Xanthomonas campestris pv. raphani 756C]|nr:dTDP-4-dehydrorhamnose 3,5-epimerase [Xanthomonas campestris pv. raphani 756C]